MSKVVLITGASSGIGKNVSLFLTKKGFSVYGTCRNPDKYNINEFSLLKCDINSNEEIKKTVEFIVKKENKIDILINNAGIGITGPIEETTELEIKSAFQTNLFGPINIIKACIPHMRKNHKGLIINITSVLGYFGIPYRGIYCSTKSSLEIVGEVLSMELKKFNIIDHSIWYTSVTHNRNHELQKVGYYDQSCPNAEIASQFIFNLPVTYNKKNSKKFKLIQNIYKKVNLEMI